MRKERCHCIPRLLLADRQTNATKGPLHNGGPPPSKWMGLNSAWATHGLPILLWRRPLCWCTHELAGTCTQRRRQTPRCCMHPHPVGLVGVEEVLGAHGACRDVAALVARELGEVHARVALHAVARIDAEALADAAQVAVGAVVDLAPRLVVVQVADVAVVPGQDLAAGAAAGCKGKGCDREALEAGIASPCGLGPRHRNCSRCGGRH
jgi:hypothetical protein